MKSDYDFETQIRKLKELTPYRFLSRTDIAEINAVGVTMEHVKTGAKVFLLLSDDRNKVFTIGFRTPSMNSTGVAHIIEHTVLCGSGKFPSKDPFVELVKGSLNTFLNAMTYPDKTLYPVASCNDTDFQNLMDVYLDAVFHPNIYREEKIFRQEGWHYEMADKNSPLTYNGVVYNEMKGVYSSADGIMERDITKVLYQGHPYGEESGGDPDFIPELTYEEYLNFHRKYYSPTNSYIYLYGNLDFADKLLWMDREYLSGYEKRQDSVLSSVIPDVRHREKPENADFDYPVAESESEKKATYLTLNTLVGGELDPLKYLGFQTLDYILLQVPGAILHDALINAGIGDDVYGGYTPGLSYPYFSVIAKNTEEDRKGEFLSVIKGTLRKLADNGIDRDMLRAAINVAEFKAREADFGNYPKGLMYGLQSYDSWLYDADPCMHLKFQGVFDELKKKTDEGFFEGLIRDYLLDNPDEAVITFHPVKGLAASRENAQKEKLKKIRESMTEEEIEKVVRETAELKAYQSEPSRKEDLLKIPMLKRSDIGKAAEKTVWEERKAGNIPVVFSNLFTSGIAYVKTVFRLDGLSGEDLSYLSFLKEVLGYIDTEKHTYAEMATQINLNSGGIGFGTESYPDFKKENESVFTFSANAKVLYEKLKFAFTASSEMLLHSKLEDTGRLKEILSEIKSGMRDKLTSAGHTAAANRAASFYSKDASFADCTGGIAYYQVLEKVQREYETDPEALSKKLSGLAGKVFTRDRMVIHLTADEKGYSLFEEAVKGFAEQFPETSGNSADTAEPFAYAGKNTAEGWTASSQVNYVARSGNFLRHGFSYTGVLKILQVLMSYDYLWNNIRVKGGAYGCKSFFGHNGDTAFASYRDPKLLETDRIYEGIPDYLKNYSADEREMTKAIIGTISDLDMPKTPLTRGLRGLSAYFSHVTDEGLQKERDEILAAQPEDIRALEPLLKAVLSDRDKCAVGNETQIREHADAFTAVEPLFKD